MKITTFIILYLCITSIINIERSEKRTYNFRIQNKLDYEFYELKLLLNQIDYILPTEEHFIKGIPFQKEDKPFIPGLIKIPNSKTFYLPFSKIDKIYCDNSEFNSLLTKTISDSTKYKFWYNNGPDECIKIGNILNSRRIERRDLIQKAINHIDVLGQNYITNTKSVLDIDNSLFNKDQEINRLENLIKEEEAKLKGFNELVPTLNEIKDNSNLALQAANNEVTTIITNINNLNSMISNNDKTIATLEKSKTDKSITKSSFEQAAKLAMENFSSAIKELVADTSYDIGVIDVIKQCLEKKDIKECNFDKLLPL